VREKESVCVVVCVYSCFYSEAHAQLEFIRFSSNMKTQLRIEQNTISRVLRVCNRYLHEIFLFHFPCQGIFFFPHFSLSLFPFHREVTNEKKSNENCIKSFESTDIRFM